MNGIVLGAVAVGLVLLVVATRPVLARIGVGYALARPRNALGIVIGLMVAGSVVMSAGIVSDSAAENYLDTILSNTAYGDGMVVSANERSFVSRHEMESFFGASALSALVADTSVGIRVELPMDGQGSVSGRDDAVVWGVDPAGHVPLRGAGVLEGSVPTGGSDWAPNEAVLTRRMAADLAVDVGDTVAMYILDDRLRQPPPPLNLASADAEGVLVLATQDPSNGSYIHHPDDEYVFPFEPVPGTLQVDVHVQARTYQELEMVRDLELVVQMYEDGELVEEHEFGDRSGNFSLEGRSFGDSEWELQVHSPFAASTDLFVNLRFWWRDPSWAPPSTDPVTVPLVVRALVEDEGTDLLTRRGVAFVPLATMQGAFNVTDRVNAAFVSAVPGANMDVFEAELREAANGQQEGWRPEVHVPMAGVEQVLAQIRLETQVFFLASSMFTFLAGLLLIVVIMALLAEERKTTIATMRALGADRSAVTRMYIVEGALYAGGAAVAAVLAAALLVAGLREPLSQMYPQIDTFRLHVSPVTILAAMGVAFALTVATIAVAAHRVSRLDPVAAMRGEDQSDQATRSSGLVVAGVVVALGSLMLLVGLAGDNGLLFLLGPIVALVGVVLVLRRTRNDSSVMAVASLAALVWTAWRVAALDVEADSMWDWLVLPAGAVLIGLSAASVFVHSAWIHRGLVAVTASVRGLGPVVDTALSHLRARPGRAFLTIGMLATVLVVITTMGTLATTFGPPAYQETGGFAVLADTSFDLGDPQEHWRENPPNSGIDPFPMMERWAATPWVRSDQLTEEAEPGSYRQIMYRGAGDESAVGVTPGFIGAARFNQATVAPEYGSLQETMRAVAQDPGLVILTDRAIYWRETPQGSWEERAPVQVGDRLVADNRADDTQYVRVVGLVHDMDGVAVIAHPSLIETYSARYGFQEAGTRIWAQPVSGVSDAELASALESAFRSTGLEATLAADPNPEWSDVDRAFMTVFMIFLSLGLVIGIVALGLVTVRNTMVRRREIGVIRAMGGRPTQVLLVFAVEALYVVLTAIAIGLVGGLWVVVSMLGGRESMTLQDDVFFVVDPVMLGSIYGVTLLAGLATAVASSWHASRIPPAEAVRYVE